MRQVKFRLTEDEYNLATVNAMNNGIDSVNVFAKRKVLENEATPVNVAVTSDPTKPVKTCLYPHELELLKRNAKLHGMSLSREIAIRLRKSFFKEEICFYPKETLELKKLASQINKVGRNIHFIINGERFCTVNDPIFRKEIQEVISLCNEVDERLKSLTQSLLNRFD